MGDGKGEEQGVWCFEQYVLSLSLPPTMLIDMPFIDALDWFLPFYLDRQTDGGVCASVCDCVCAGR